MMISKEICVRPLIFVNESQQTMQDVIMEMLHQQEDKVNFTKDNDKTLMIIHGFSDLLLVNEQRAFQFLFQTINCQLSSSKESFTTLIIIIIKMHHCLHDIEQDDNMMWIFCIHEDMFDVALISSIEEQFECMIRVEPSLTLSSSAASSFITNMETKTRLHFIEKMAKLS